jgi:predicted dehydrogenase
MFRTALTETYTSSAELVAVCDSNPLRATNWLAHGELDGIPKYGPAEFLEMLRRHSVDCVIVTTMDRTHHHYICEAMRAGCDVITEKPMTTDAEKCREILEVQRETGRRVQVTFNYRYSPRSSKIKEVLDAGAIGEVLSVHFEWLLSTKHGADYFRRWHREKANGGGLLVHKATHHFDLINWWLGTVPSQVCVFGGLRFYGRINRERHGFGRDYPFATGNPNAKGDPYAIHLDDWSGFGQKVYHEPAALDGYRRDQNVFGDGISIEDDLAVLVRYQNQATLSYHLTAYSPWEGYRIMFNGTKGRLEFEVAEKSYISAAEGDHNFSANIKGASEIEIEEPATLLLRPHWRKVQNIPLPVTNEGGHGGGDKLMLDDIFATKAKKPDPLAREANHVSGAWSILTGIAGNRSIAENRIVSVSEFGLNEFLSSH